MQRQIEWDDAKAQANFSKHGIRFQQAVRVFDDPLAHSVLDRVERGEARWQTVGLVDGSLLLLVAHTLRLSNDQVELVRIISARRADKAERRRYENG